MNGTDIVTVGEPLPTLAKVSAGAPYQVKRACDSVASLALVVDGLIRHAVP
jgi:hypothetical protein